MQAAIRPYLGVPSLCRDSSSAARTRRPRVHVRSFKGEEGHEKMVAAAARREPWAQREPPASDGDGSKFMMAAIGLGLALITSAGGTSWFISDRIGNVQTELYGVRAELSKEISGVRTELSKEISGVRTELSKEIYGVRVNLARLEGSLTSSKKK